MPEFKKSTGYKMKGFSYPGESPLKGKKMKEKRAQAKAAATAAQEKIAAFGQMQLGTGGEMGGQFKVDLPPTISGAPIKKKDDTTLKKQLPEITVTDKKKINWADEAGASVAGLIKTGVEIGGSAIAAQIRKKTKNKKKIGPSISKFSKMKFGKKDRKSPVKLTDKERRANLLKAVPNKAAYDKLSPEDQKGFDIAAKKVGLPTKTSPATKKRKYIDFHDLGMQYSDM